MSDRDKSDMISIEEMVDLIKKHTLPKESLETEKMIRTKNEYFNMYELIKNAGYGKFEEMLGDLCFRSHNRKMNYKGHCSVCGKASVFEIDYMFAELTGNDKLRLPIWRERMVCPDCGLNNRMRYMLGKVKEAYNPGMKVYINEQVTRAYKELKKYIPDLVGSEYLDEKYESGKVVDGILHENAMDLSFQMKHLIYFCLRMFSNMWQIMKWALKKWQE